MCSQEGTYVSMLGDHCVFTHGNACFHMGAMNVPLPMNNEFPQTSKPRRDFAFPKLGVVGFHIRL